jgi:hypothetical protein
VKRLALLAVAAGCAHARTPDAYRADTATLLAAQDSALKACYDKVLQTMPTAAGHVVVTFDVEPKTGHLTNAAIDPAQTTAPDAVNQCVLVQLPQLALAPGDRKLGKATWSWDFVAQATPAAAHVDPGKPMPAAPAAPLAAPAPAPGASAPASPAKPAAAAPVKKSAAATAPAAAPPAAAPPAAAPAPTPVLPAPATPPRTAPVPGNPAPAPATPMVPRAR